MKDFFKKFKLGPHYAMERFGVSVAILLIFTILLSTGIGVHVVHANSELMSTKAIYTKEFTSSVTETSGTVEKIYSNEDKTDCFIVLKFDNVDLISTNAKDYMMFLTGSDKDINKQKLKSHPGGMIYMFGSTGYMGIHLFEEKGFPKQILSLTIRCNNQIKKVDESEDEDDDDDDSLAAQYSDESFKTHDQFRIYFNPAGTDAENGPFLDDSKVDIKKMYYYITLSDRETELRKKLSLAVANLNNQLNLVNEYGRRLTEDDGMQLPALPPEVNGDYITAKDKDGNELKKDIDVWRNSDNKVVDSENVVLYYNSPNVLSGGVNFNWQDKSAQEGYLADLYDGEDYAGYLDKLSETSKPSLSTTEFRWYRKDGSEFVYSASGGSSREGDNKTVNADITNYTKAISDYFNLKKSYQCDLLLQLLDIEYEGFVVSKRFSINDTLGVLTLY